MPNILFVLLAVLPIGFILLLSEYLWRKKMVKGERARKFIHILAGVWIAFWPFYIPFDGIFILGCMALVFLLYSRFSHVFGAIYAVKRRTYGEIFYAIAIIFSSYYGEEPWVFTISILLLALADGGAAVIGRLWGVNNEYLVFGKKCLRKSVAGTVTYLILAYVSIFIGWILGGSFVMNDNTAIVFFVLPLSATFLENIAPYGLDNLLTPLFATILLNSLL
jgi:dolichol kinase